MNIREIIKVKFISIKSQSGKHFQQTNPIKEGKEKKYKINGFKNRLMKMKFFPSSLQIDPHSFFCLL